MTTLHACAFVALSAFAVACGGGNSDNNPDALIVILDAAPDAPPPPPDAPSFDFSCMNNPAPDTAPATITVAGTAQDIDLATQTFEGVAAAAVVARDATDTMVGAPTVSDVDGNWTLTALLTGSVPIDGYVEASKTGHRTTRVYPPQPMSADQSGIPVPLLASGTFSLLVGAAGAEQSAANGTVGLVVLDCAGTPVGGATISVKQNDTEVGTQFDLSQFQPGAWFIFDVPPGETVVNATVQGMTFRAHTIGVEAQTTSGTIVNPGFI
jgi:hypothetical protein